MYGTYCRLVGRFNLTVWASDAEVRQGAKRMLSSAGRAPSARKARERFYREMLRYHHKEQRLCIRFCL